MQIAVRYTMFALVATLANIGSQEVSIRLYNGSYGFFLSVMVGTAVGLVTKYLLDKRLIFNYQTRDIAHDTRTFTLYSMTGVFTTLIFWGFEFSFAYLFPSREMRYLGGVIGLGIGYFIKYRLDRRFVFTLGET
jgi:putative flippase GtrA